MSRVIDAGELASLALHIGFVRGALSRPETVGALVDRGVSIEDIDAAKAVLNKISEAFYRQN